MEKKYLIVGLVILVMVAGYIMLNKQYQNHDALAQCITSKGAKMYGAFWCPHCNDQKDMFGDSWGYITYVECSTPDGYGKTDACIQADVNAYPMWEFKNGTRHAGLLTFEELGKATQCEVK